MSLIAGLGNPGAEYEHTRHNVGFALIDRIADVLSITFQKGNGPWLAGEGQFKGSPLYLIKPMTYMNRSGVAVKQAISYYGAPLQDCLICYDDINLKRGIIRLRMKGSAGGHNGLTDILNTLDTDEIPRLRIGIGNDFPKGRQADYVLSPFTSEEQITMDEALDRAVEAVFTFVRIGAEQAMNKFN